MNHLAHMTQILEAIESHDPDQLARKLHAACIAKSVQDTDPILIAGATALVNWDSCALEIIAHPNLKPSAEGESVDWWLKDYLDFRISMPENSISKFKEGNFDAMLLRRRLSELIRNLVFELPIDGN